MFDFVEVLFRKLSRIKQAPSRCPTHSKLRNLEKEKCHMANLNPIPSHLPTSQAHHPFPPFRLHLIAIPPSLSTPHAMSYSASPLWWIKRAQSRGITHITWRTRLHQFKEKKAIERGIPPKIHIPGHLPGISSPMNELHLLDLAINSSLRSLRMSFLVQECEITHRTQKVDSRLR